MPFPLSAGGPLEYLVRTEIVLYSMYIRSLSSPALPPASLRSLHGLRTAPLEPCLRPQVSRFSLVGPESRSSLFDYGFYEDWNIPIFESADDTLDYLNT